MPGDVDEDGIVEVRAGENGIGGTERNDLGISKQFSDEFSEQHSGSEDENAGTIPGKLVSNYMPQSQYTKLEVVQARQIEKLMMLQHIFLAIAIAFTLVVVILTAVSYSFNFSPAQWQGEIELKIIDPPKSLLWFNYVSALFTFSYSLLLCVVFTVRIMRLRRQARTHEQTWVIGLLICLTVYLLPWTDVYKIHDFLQDPDIRQEDRWGSQPWYVPTSTTFALLRQSTFTASTVFYIWASVHSYRLLESDIGIMFYLPKVVVLGTYVAVKCMVWIQYDVQPAEMMFASFFGMISLYSTADRWDYVPGILFGVGSLLFEVTLGGYILHEIWTTKDVLKKADYIKYRTKQIGFRFFVYHNMVFYIVFWCLYMLLLLGVPSGLKAFSFRVTSSSVFEVHDFLFGIQVMLLAYATVEAYANLPADALGFKGWFLPQSPRGLGDATELEPITYRKREPPSLKGVTPDLNVNCFVMQTHVTMFNFAWLVYYWDTPKVEDFKLTQDVFKFTVAQFIKDRPTDTHVLVVDGEDRIVIAFKGTTSTKNLRTDINMFYSNARSLLPTMLGAEDEAGDAAARENPLLHSKAWRWSKVHKGFAVAYAAVAPMLLSTVKRLQEERRRPVFITGHSLGGALATICSLDLNLRLGITRREVFVSTFGAPRVGNRQFSSLYNDIVPIHWRIVVGPDVVAKLPKVGFTHVGKKVLITVDGDLFIDPNSLELNLWSGDVASILYHRKASYLLAMRAWCERHHGDEYLPEFWPFPVSKDDTRRFEHAMVRSMNGAPASHGGVGAPRARTVSKRSRMRQLDAMIDALEGPPAPAGSPEAVELWARLARGLAGDAGAGGRGEAAGGWAD